VIQRLIAGIAASINPASPRRVVFGIVWTVIDSLLAFSAYRLLTAPPSRSRSAALGCLAVSVLGVAAHPWTMFGRRRQDEATAVTAGMQQPPIF
jgi:translocator protein